MTLPVQRADRAAPAASAGAGARRQRVLVTGGAGLLGVHLCRALLAGGHAVVCVDNFSTGARSAIEPLLADRAFALLQQDVTQPLQLDVDAIYNLACPASPVHYQSDPVRTIRTCVIGAINVLDLAQRTHARILQASTSEVYGSPLSHPQREGDWGNVNPVGIRSCYDEGKRCAETLFFDYHRQHHVDIRVARIFNTYGPGMSRDDGRVVSNFIVQALRNDPITLHGDGRQTRSFCYVADMIDGLVRLMATPAPFTGPVNLGNPQEITMRELADTVIRLTGSRSRVVNVPRPADDPDRRQPDISLATQALGWHPATALEDGLRATIAAFERSLLTDAAA